MEEKIKKLSEIITYYSLKIKPKDRVLITYSSTKSNPLIKELITNISKKGGICFIKLVDEELENLLINLTDNERIKAYKNLLEYEINNYDCFINIIYNINDFIASNTNIEIKNSIANETKELNEIKINKRRWILLNYPSELDAHKAHMYSEESYQFAFNVMTIDYQDLYKRLQPLKQLMEKTDLVRIISPNTDLSFSIKNMPIIPCCGEENLPDGEIFTAPIKQSINGIIKFNTPSLYQGNLYNNIELTFKDGKIIKAKSDNNEEQLNELLNTDDGSRYIGEFAIGLNPKILKPMGDVLFDEKIIGSIHLTPGSCYDEANNGNKSTIHFDMVLIQRKEYGGGEIYFDHTLIRKDGLFVLPELKSLNYNML